MCYNAANHWDLGWFYSGRRDLGTTGPSIPIKITLTGFVSYPVGNTFLVKIGTVYMQYNHAFAHNIDTDPSTANQLVVVQKGPGSFTSRLAVLDQGEEYRSGTFVVRVCAKQATSIDISIGRSNTNCEATANSPPPPLPQPATQPTTAWGNNWFQSAPGPAPTALHWWNPPPAPQFSRPTISIPSSNIIWFPQKPSTVVLLKPVSASPPFSYPSPASSNWFRTPALHQPKASGWPS